MMINLTKDTAIIANSSKVNICWQIATIILRKLDLPSPFLIRSRMSRYITVLIILIINAFILVDIGNKSSINYLIQQLHQKR
jgi:hypothetical protein